MFYAPRSVSGISVREIRGAGKHPITAQGNWTRRPRGKKLFDPFFTTAFHGAGPRATPRSSASYAAHKGAIQGFSKPGNGSTFRVLFPRGNETSPAGSRPSPPQVRKRGHERHGAAGGRRGTGAPHCLRRARSTRVPGYRSQQRHRGGRPVPAAQNRYRSGHPRPHDAAHDGRGDAAQAQRPSTPT